MTDQLYIGDGGSVEAGPLSWDGVSLFSRSTVREGLFDASAFEQMPGQMAMDACWCDGLPGRCSACIAGGER